MSATAVRNPSLRGTTYRVAAAEPFDYSDHDNFYDHEQVAGASFWYDRNLKLWTIYRVDERGYQIGSAQYANTKGEAERTAETMAQAPR